MLKVLCYKSEGHWFNSRWCYWNFSLTYSFRSHCGPGVDSASNRNEYQEYFLGGKGGRCVRLTTYHHPVPLSWNLGTLTYWNPLGLSRPVTGRLDTTRVGWCTTVSILLVSPKQTVVIWENCRQCQQNTTELAANVRSHRTSHQIISDEMKSIRDDLFSSWF